MWLRSDHSATLATYNCMALGWPFGTTSDRVVSSKNLCIRQIMSAKARRVIKQAKRDSWRTYISKLTSNTSAKRVWDMVKRICGKSQPSAIHHLMVDNNRMEHPQNIANTLASIISINSSNEHCTKTFRKLKPFKKSAL
jgi:hypothetical protein